MQVCPYDIRHTLTTVCRSMRHSSRDHINLYIYEDNPEAISRHLLLLAIVLDETVGASEKMQRFLEVFGNHFLREDTFEYLKKKCYDVERVLEAKIAQRSEGDDNILSDLLDISYMRYDAKDAVLAAVVQARSSPRLDLKAAWDFRCRKWYGDRYDFRKNMVRERCLK